MVRALCAPFTPEGLDDGEGLLKVFAGVVCEASDESCLMVEVTVIVLVIKTVNTSPLSSYEFDEEGEGALSAVDVTTTVLVIILTQISSRRNNGGTAETSAANRKSARKNMVQVNIFGKVTVERWKTGLKERP